MYAAFWTFLIAFMNYLEPPTTVQQAAAIRVFACFTAGVAIGRCLRLIYPEK